MGQNLYRATIPSPLGDLFCAASDDAVILISFKAIELYENAPGNGNSVLTRLRRQLDEYFAGSRRSFSVPAGLSGTAHQLKVWDALRDIPYGETVTYRDIANAAGSVPIAAGQAVGRNPVNILIPCHRVLGSGGRLTGYSGGTERKQFLLDLEARNR